VTTRKKGEPLGPRGWFATLTPGMLVIACNAAAKKFHLVYLGTRGDLYDSRHGKPYTSRFGYDDAGERWDFSEVWDADSLCGRGSDRSTFGHHTSYYWKPRPDAVASYDLTEEICASCLRTFRRKNPGQDLAALVVTRKVDEAAWDPPFGWRVVAPERHPYDVPSDIDPGHITNKAGESVGVRREEISRWVRGIRVVRLCKLIDEPGRYSVNLHNIGDELHDEWKLQADHTSCLRKAHEIMARGGR